ncbi:MAG: RHS repeat-associated core domain-containing protein [Candidatus Sulfotelmatobacter sp.]|jgi:RHS repeat-associated protein
MARLGARLSISAILILFTLYSSQAAAQTADPTGGAGVKAYGVYHGTSIEHISLETSKLIINIPLISYPQRGGKLRVEFALHWYNPVYSYTHLCSPYLNPRCLTTFESAQPPGLFEALAGLPYLTGVFVNNNPLSQNNTIWDSDGGGHQMAPVDSAGQGPIYRSIDATGYWLNEATSSNPTTTIIDPNGVRYIYPASGAVTAEDSNGNEMTIGSSVVDTLGRTIPFPLSTSNPTTSNFTGCTGPLPTTSASLWTPPDQNGGTVTFKFCYAGVHIQINGLPSPCPAQTQCVEPNGNFAELQSIVLPNGTAWEFEYNGGTNPSDSTVNAGLLSKITLPTGGTISYTWNTPPENTVVSAYSVYFPAVTSRTINANDGTGAKTWSYAGGTITDPLGNNEVHTLTEQASCQGVGTFYDTQDQYYQGSIAPANLLKTVNKTYASAPNPYLVTPCTGVVNVVPLTTTTTWKNGQVSQETKSYDSGFANYPEGYLEYDLYGKVVSDTYYDYGASAPGPVLKQVNNAWLALTNANYLNGNLLNLLSSQQIVNASGAQQAYTSNTYDSQSLLSSGVTTQFTTAPNGAYRGNLTGISRWLNTTNSNLTTTNTYYDAGMLGKTQDPVGNITQLFYSTSYAGGYLTSLKDALNHTTTFTYDYNTGEMASKIDENNQTTHYYYDDMRRLSQVKYPDGGQINYQYTETAVPYSVTTTEAISSSINKVDVEYVDGFGRETRSALTSDPDGTAYVDTSYDGLGRKYTVSNPYRTTGDSSYGTTTYLYDALGRTLSVSEPDKSTVATTYCGSSTLVTDEAGHWRRRTTDGLGRLIEADEPNSSTATVTACPQSGDPIVATTYGYNPLDDLTSVIQAGSRSRSFVFDSLSRLVSSINPESNTTPTSSPVSVATTYNYDSDGNVLSKVEPAQNQTGTATVTLSYCYDALNRMTSKAYSAQSCPMASPVATYSYDQSACLGQSACYNVGRRTEMIDPAGSENWSYDTMGRVLTDERTTNGLTKSASYTYFLDGSVYTLGYPSGRVVTYQTGAAGRALSAIDVNNSINYATNAHYAPHGPIASLTSNSNIFSTEIYNSRLQPCWIYATSGTALPISTPCSAVSTPGNMLDLQYNYNLGADNGNVMGIANNRDTTRSQSFTYDQLNRVATAAASTYATSPTNCWGQSFTYDNWANLLAIDPISSAYSGCTQTSLTVAVNSQNQMIGETYDTAGNLLTDPAFNTNSYTYNAENQMTQKDSIAFVYDGDGKRIEKANGTLYWYDADGNVLDTTNLQGVTTGVAASEYIFFAGRRIARRDGPGDVYYYFADHLGTLRTMAEVPEGQTTATLCYDADYYPFSGDAKVFNSVCQAPNYLFTGKEHDTEDNLDYFGARYYSSEMGRFMTPDWAAKPATVPYAEFGDPQTLNLYTYVENSPLNRVDANGHGQQQSGDSEAACFNGAASCTLSQNQQPPGQNQQAQNTVLDGLNRITQGINDFVKTYVNEIDSNIPFSGVSSPSASNGTEKAAVGLGFLAGFAAGDGEGAAGSRAGELANAMGKTKDFVTIAVTETKEGLNIISSSENALRPAVRALLGSGEVAATGAGHAEVTGVNTAKQMGLTPTGVAASRGICPSCAQFLRDAGVAALSALKAVPF